MKTMIHYFAKRVLTFAFICSFTYANAQAPNKMSYQAVVRNSSNALVQNQGVGMRVSILQGSASGAEIYKEIYNPNPITNANGLVTVEIGSGLALTGTFSAINWAGGPFFIKTETDPSGGTNYSVSGATQLLSVPYALYAATSGSGNLSGTTGSLIKFTSSNAGGDSQVREDATGVGVNVAPGPISYRLRVDGITGSFNDNGIHIRNTSINSGWNLYPSSSGELIIGRTSNLGTFNGTSGAYTSISDARLKTNPQTLENVLPALMKIPVMRYEFKYNNPMHTKDLGVFAQDVQQFFPELVTVHSANDGNPLVKDQLGLNYAGLSVIAIKAIQEQQVMIEALKKMNEELLKRLQLLEQKK